MVCVLQSKLPGSSAVFQLYCQLFFFFLSLFVVLFFFFLTSESVHNLHLLLLRHSAESAAPSCFPVCFTNLFWGLHFIFGHSVSVCVPLHLSSDASDCLQKPLGTPALQCCIQIYIFYFFSLWNIITYQLHYWRLSIYMNNVKVASLWNNGT